MMQLEASYSDAKNTISQLMQSGKGDQACRDLAKATAKEVTDSVAASQKTVADMPNGGQCANEGQNLVTDAENAKKAAEKAQADAQTALNNAKGAKINFGDFVVSSLTEGQCSYFYGSQVWKDAKAKIASAQTTLNTKTAETTAAGKAVETAKNTAKQMVKECQCKSKEAIEKAIKDLNAKSKSSNQAAWNKSHHMLCVLDGKAVNSCSVPALPVVKPVPFGAGVYKACGPEVEKSIYLGQQSGGNQNYHHFTLYKLTKTDGYSDDKAGMDKYMKDCTRLGLKGVGCGTSSYNASPQVTFEGKTGYLTTAMPNAWGCNMMSSLSSNTGWGNDIVAFQEKYGNGAALYTPKGHPTGSWQLHAVCSN